MPVRRWPVTSMTGGHVADPPVTQLVEQAADGSQEAWDRIVDGHAALVWAVIRSHRMPPGEAEDVFQTAWLRLVENLHRLEQPDRLAGWLVTTTRRECLRALRHTDREVPDGPMTHAADDIAPHGPGPVDALLNREQQAELVQAFNGLSERCQDVLRLTVLSPKPVYTAVAEALDMPVGSLGPTRGRCLRHLRALLGANHPVDEKKGGP